MVLTATYAPAPRGWREHGNACYLHSGPKREACAWYCIPDATYTPAPRGRRVCRLNAAYTPAPKGGRVRGMAGVLSPNRTTGAAARHEWTAGRGWTRQRPAGRRLTLPGEKRV